MKAVQRISLVVLLASIMLIVVFASDFQFYNFRPAQASTIEASRWQIELEARRQGTSVPIATMQSQMATLIAELETRQAQATAEATSYSSFRYVDPVVVSNGVDSTLLNLWLVTLVSLATFVTTTFYRMRDERRMKTMHELGVAKTQLEVDELRRKKEREEAEQVKRVARKRGKP